MKNPYEILGISQNANAKDITKGRLKAMVERKHTNQEIANAAQQLMMPAKRLVADFLFPSKIKAKRPKLLQSNITTFEDIDDIDENALNSLSKEQL